ncbi:aryl-alcohol dehydrogenase-like predicted oxidoreductase [Paenibacillus endophyticus]|uniref:Aryl-alcohol dehydrogenase-like predicted oxidoreductase n=1 Tax=Paenibacillus endophyticus TaxID=1294268 RepID=A0A7W5CAH3_9BACL|nr:aldo/keto reductase [Paenibacillus endophyticus]MBB3154157.1 aryl-alcohol dehydrogenase-like predicted oxidoreductase [Paenibacillus endophyticus]
MKRNRLGTSELYVSEIGLGCMSLGQEKNKAISLIHKAMDNGVNFLDTADLYDEGLNEEIVGQAVRGRRSDVIIATKVGNRWEPGKEGWSWDPSKSYIKSAVKASLRRLQTEYIDLYQLHGGTLDDPISETIEAFEELKQEGLIRYYGISSIRPNVIREYADRANIVSVMSQYSMLDRRPEEQVLPLLAEKEISLIARGPVAKGILTGAGAEKAKKGYLSYGKDELIALHASLLKAIDPSRDIAHAAIRYALADPAVATVIPGASSAEQLLHNIAAGAAAELTQEEWTAIRSLSEANRYEQHR